MDSKRTLIRLKIVVFQDRTYFIPVTCALLTNKMPKVLLKLFIRCLNEYTDFISFLPLQLSGDLLTFKYIEMFMAIIKLS